MQRKIAQSPESTDGRMSKTNADIQQKIMFPLVHFSPWNHDDGLRPLAVTQEELTFPSTSHFIAMKPPTSTVLDVNL